MMLKKKWNKYMRFKTFVKRRENVKGKLKHFYVENKINDDMDKKNNILLY
jgi:hypothetical protein